MASVAPQLDTLQQTETPEGVHLDLPAAGLPARGLAWLIDMLLRLVLMGFVIGALTPLKGFGQGALAIIFFLMEWFYPVLFELAPGSATPGKRALGLQVVMASGLPVTAPASLLRNLLRAVDFLPLFYLSGGLCMLLRADFRRPGDLVAGTLVVYRPRRLQAHDWPAGPACAPARPLDLAQQAVVLNLADRHHRLTPARLDELAGRIEAWLPAAEALPGGLDVDRSPSARLFSLARRLLGQPAGAGR